jgi:GH18 family chitinase
LGLLWCFPGSLRLPAPEGGGTGTKLKDFQNTCVANCGNEIKQNSGAPAVSHRIGYYEFYNVRREFLHIKAKNANTDGSYTHMHWVFGDIEPKTWKPVVNEFTEQWEHFKKLPNMKRILSLGGWAYATEPATYNITREAIINNRNNFAANLAKFGQDEGIDGFDIDSNYPGAADIAVNSQPIGKTTDGLDYIKFLIVLKKAVGKDKSVSLAAPAPYWYLRAFPIDRIAASIDHIVYMIYGLHGQWDYGSPNAYDLCPSGKCIRSYGK